MFRFLKSIHILKLPFFFRTTTKLEHQDECLVGAIIPAANIFSSSFLTMRANLGFICLNFCRKDLTSLVSCFKGMVCWNTSSRYALSSSYEKAKTSLYSLTKFIKSFLSFLDVPFPIFINFGFLSDPILIYT